MKKSERSGGGGIWRKGGGGASYSSSSLVQLKGWSLCAGKGLMEKEEEGNTL